VYVQYMLIVKSAYGLQQIIAVNKANNDYNFAEYKAATTAKVKKALSALGAEAKQAGEAPTATLRRKLGLKNPLVMSPSWCKEIEPHRKQGVNPERGKVCKSNCKWLPCTLWKRLPEVCGPTFDQDDWAGF
jgi:hypothetical protein